MRTRNRTPYDLLKEVDGGGLDETGVVPQGREHLEFLVAAGLLGLLAVAALWRFLAHPDLHLPAQLLHRLAVGAGLAVAAFIAAGVGAALLREFLTRRTLRTRQTVQVLTGDGDPPLEAVAAFAHQMLGARRRLSWLRWVDESATAFRVLLSRDESGRPAVYWQVPVRFMSVLFQAAQSYRHLGLRQVEPGTGLPAFQGRAARLELRPARAEAYPLRNISDGWDRLRALAAAIQGADGPGERLVLAWDLLPVAPRTMVPLRKRMLHRARSSERRDPLQWWEDLRDVSNPAEAIERRIERTGLWEKVGNSQPMYRLQVLAYAETNAPSGRKRARELVEKAFAAAEQWAGQNFFRAVGLFVLGLPFAGSDAIWRRGWFDYRLRTGRFGHRTGPLGGGGRVVNWSEVGELFRGWGRAVDGVERVETRQLDPPEGAPTAGMPLGEAEPSGVSVAIRPQEILTHALVSGTTGVGKTTLLTNWLLALANDTSVGAALIDPKDGKAIYEALERMPREHADRVVLIDPWRRDADPEHDRVVGLNVLECPDPTQRELVADQIGRVFQNIFGASWGQRGAALMRMCVLTLLQHPGSTLVDIIAMLENREVRARLTHGLDDPILHQFWTHFDERWAKDDSLETLLYKLREVVLRSSVRDVLCQPTSTIDVRHLIDHGGLILVSLPKGLVGEESSRLTGSIIFTKIWQAAMARADIPREQDRPISVVMMDEFHNFVHLPLPFDEVLAEARGFHLPLVLGLQHLGQLPGDVREAVTALTRTKVAFHQEAAQVAASAALVPPVKEGEFAALGPYRAAVRMYFAGQSQPAFITRTRPLPQGFGREHAETIARASLDRYGRPRAEIEADIARRLGGKPPKLEGPAPREWGAER